MLQRMVSKVDGNGIYCDPHLRIGLVLEILDILKALLTNVHDFRFAAVRIHQSKGKK